MSRNSVILLTQGISLPDPPLHRRHLDVIVRAIDAAWRDVLADGTALAAEDVEAEINGAVQARLLVLRRSPSPFRTLVSGLGRGSEQFNYDGTLIEKRPDLNFTLTRRDAAFPLVAECKIIDARNGQTVVRYRKSGLERFLGGDYAWFHSQALMVAYVRDATIATEGVALASGAAPIPWPTTSGPHLETRHARSFRYVGRSPEDAAPGPISLIHLWLDARRPRPREATA